MLYNQQKQSSIFFLGKEAVNKSIRNELNLLVPVLKKAISVAFLSSGT